MISHFYRKSFVSATIAFWCSSGVASDSEIEQLRIELRTLKNQYEQRISDLEAKLSNQSVVVKQVDLNSSKSSVAAERTSKTGFNPNVSIVLDGQFSSYKNHTEDYELPGFALGGEAGLVEDGLTIGHTEITASANVDDKFFGQLSLAIAEHEGATEVELEEAFIESTGMSAGLTIRGGRFLTSVGYLNQQHKHAWDFADAPLIYSGLWGNRYIDDGLRVSWIAPTDHFLELGGELLAGGHFPAGGERSSGSGAQVYYLNTGGDWGVSNSWKAGVSYFTADVENRTSGGHSHGEDAVEIPGFSGDSSVTGVNLVYKWAPFGNYKNRFLKLQGEYFWRDEDGLIELDGSDPLETTSYAGGQEGYYMQAVYQFMPQWRTGLRFDYLESENRGSDEDVLGEAGLLDKGVDPQRWSFMLEWLPSEFSRLRLQYNRDESYANTDDQIILQYTMSLGAHGAHSF